MATGLTLTVRRGSYWTGTRLLGTGALQAAIGSTVLDGDEIWEGSGQTRYARIVGSTIVLTPN